MYNPFKLLHDINIGLKTLYIKIEIIKEEIEIINNRIKDIETPFIPTYTTNESLEVENNGTYTNGEVKTKKSTRKRGNRKKL